MAPVSMSLIAVIGACDYRLSFTDIGQLDGSLFMERCTKENKQTVASPLFAANRCQKHMLVGSIS